MTNPTRKSLRLAALALLATAALTMTVQVARATDSEAWTLYQKFVGECETATSMNELLPFLPAWRHERHEASDEAGRKEAFERICKATRDLKDIALVSEKAKGAETVLQLKASWDDSPMKGKVTIVREDDGLKVDEWSWATGQ